MNTNKPNTILMDGDIEKYLLNPELDKILTDSIKNIETYISSNNGKGKEDSEKDNLYQEAQKRWKELQNNLVNTKFNFHLNKAEFLFLEGLLTSYLEYDVNTIFFALELDSYLKTLGKMKFLNDNELKSIEVNTTEITYIYHLISKHKVKGLGHGSRNFAKILIKIGDISKLINYYDQTAKDLATDIQNWVASFDDNISIEELSPEAEVAEENI
jgi:hypothetical protein